MVLRILFTAEDLCRVRVAAGPHPTWEVILSINSLQSPELPARHWAWRNSVTGTVKREPERRRWLGAAAALVPANGNFPDFLTPAIGDADVDAHFDAILALPRETVRADLERTYLRDKAPPPWARSLHRDGRTGGLVEVLRRYHRIAVEPVREAVHRRVEIDRAQYARRLLDGGVEALLSGLHPSIRWRHPVLEADYPVDRTVSLGGRGLVVVPAHFCWGAPVTFIDADLEPVLVCPGGDDLPEPAPGPGAGVERLSGLLGHTRARLVAQLAVAGSTTQLATRLAVTRAAISQHTRVLRAAGLVTTTRFGPSVQHALTPLGRHLLNGEPGV
ncbi:ArsR/SmtB family transcription factor [Amycolatopsis anabasis]|uniref:ArsR/SmtB family transcription factor n=1 Tax=Amycolatopsis anabasis TaxID=1840409 RepID=UPI00131BFD85|nr:winged helix-turn-helix domain-containing protein [Amycolatopsis anabasis]